VRRDEAGWVLGVVSLDNTIYLEREPGDASKKCERSQKNLLLALFCIGLWAPYFSAIPL
jgi:hypothetical protein